MTDRLVRPELGHHWTVADLQLMPDDGLRYELIDGSLHVTPPPALPHGWTIARLRAQLFPQTPDEFLAGENIGVDLGADNYRVPDMIIVRQATTKLTGPHLEPQDVLVAVEVLSPTNRGDDLVMKRYQYGRARIGQYWIVDPREQTFTVLRHDGVESYVEAAVVRAGEAWRTDDPFPLALDPADFL